MEDRGGVDVEELRVEGQRPEHAFAAGVARGSVRGVVGQVGGIGGAAGEEGGVVLRDLARGRVGVLEVWQHVSVGCPRWIGMDAVW